MPNNDFTSVDEKLIIVNHKEKRAGDIRADRLERKRLEEEEHSDVETVKKTGQAVLKVVRKRSILEAMRQSMSLAVVLRSEMDGYYMPTGVFYSLLILAIIKDFIGVLTGTVFAFFVSLGIGFIMLIVLFGKRSLLSKILKKRVVTIVATFVAESTPVLAAAPITTLSIIWIKWDFDKKHKQLLAEVKQVESEVSVLEKQAA